MALFYLERKGMSRPQIRRFVTAFNQGIKDRLKGRSAGELLPDTLREVQAACQFEPSPTHDLHSQSGDIRKGPPPKEDRSTASSAAGTESPAVDSGAGDIAPMTLAEFEILD